LTQERVAFLPWIHPNYVSDTELGKRNISWAYLSRSIVALGMDWATFGVELDKGYAADGLRGPNLGGHERSGVFALSARRSRGRRATSRGSDSGTSAEGARHRYRSSCSHCT